MQAQKKDLQCKITDGQERSLYINCRNYALPSLLLYSFSVRLVHVHHLVLGFFSRDAFIVISHQSKETNISYINIAVLQRKEL